MKSTIKWAWILSLIFTVPTVIIAENIIFPSEAFSNGTTAGLLDVTRPPFNADNTGHTDCSEALIKAYDFIMKRVLVHRQIDPQRWSNILYLPNGTYKVSKTIIYTMDPILNSGDGHERLGGVRFLGQDQEKTIIRLIDNAPGFDNPQSPKSVISYGKININNAVASNFFENITIQIGKGNPGAIGLRFHGANNQAVRDATIEALAGQGFVGLDLAINVCQGHFKNIRVRGFDYGIRVLGSHATMPVFEYITLEKQHVAGFLAGPGGTSVRKMTSHNQVPAILFDRAHGHLVVIDSEFKGGSKKQPAIRLENGHLFARNIKTEGYSCAISNPKEKIVKEKRVREFVSDNAHNIFGERTTSLNLPIKDPPKIPWEQDFTEWAFVNDYGANGNNRTSDSRAIQRAMNSGKSVIWFKPGKYVITQTITIPATVKRVNFMFTMLVPSAPLDYSNLPGFRIEGDTEEPLIIENLVTFFEAIGHHYWFEQASTRPVILSDLHSQRTPMYRNSAENSILFMENVSACRGNNNNVHDTPFIFSKGQKVWARWINSEKAHYGLITNDNATLWLMGFKTEHVGPHPVIQLINGSVTEILGGDLNTYGWDVEDDHEPPPAILVKGSRASISVHTTGPRDRDRHFTKLVKDQKLGRTKYLSRDVLPLRENTNKCVVPLYISE